MSFKRAGDDHCALRLQKKHRVSELLLEDIPSNEATKTRHGRFVCLVCPHNPVLDTMVMLTIHRQGKKHLANMAIKIEKDHNLSELVQKRQHEKYLTNSSSSCSSVTAEQCSSTTKISQHNVSDDTKPLLDHARQVTEEIKQASGMKRPTADTDLSKKVSECISSKKNQPFFQSRVRIEFDDTFKQSSDASNIRNEESKLVTKPIDVPTMTIDKASVKAKKMKHIESSKKKELNPEQQRYLELKMSGWIMDESGCWVKDENAEFDSDEEEAPS